MYIHHSITFNTKTTPLSFLFNLRSHGFFHLLSVARAVWPRVARREMRVRPDAVALSSRRRGMFPGWSDCKVPKRDPVAGMAVGHGTKRPTLVFPTQHEQTARDGQPSRE